MLNKRSFLFSIPSAVILAGLRGRAMLGGALAATALAITPAMAADTKLSALATGNSALYTYGEEGGVSKKYNGLYIKNVKDFGAVGDGSTNDQPFIQAAVDYVTPPYSSSNRGEIYFPPTTGGVYQINSSVTFELADGILAIGFRGAPGVKIRGTFADALLKRSANSPNGGTYYIESLQLENNDPAGKGIMFHSIVGGTIRNCLVTAHIGAEVSNSQSITVQDCAFLTGGQGGAGSIGVSAGNGTAVISCDFSAFNVGIQHENLGLIIHGGRIETCTTGILLGTDNAASTGFDIAGVSMESNNTGIYLYSTVAGSIKATCPTASKPSMVCGYRVGTAQDVVIEAAAFGSSDGGWSQAGMWLQGPMSRVIFISILSVDQLNASSWSIPNGATNFAMINCNIELTVAQLPTGADIGTILPVKDSTAVAIGAAITTGSNSNHYAAVAGASGSWIRAA